MRLIAEGFLLGLSVNLSCVMVCAPVLLGFFLSENTKPISPVLKFLSGRLIAYIFFAVVSGSIGIYFNGRIKPEIFAVFEIILSVWLILFALGRITEGMPLCSWIGNRFSGRQLPFFAGIALGLNICPPFLLGLSRTLQMNSIIDPVVFFTGFYAGSSLWVLLFLFSAHAARFRIVQSLGRIFSVGVGVWFFIDALKIFIE